MVAAYSMELRDRILKAWQAKEGSQRNLAARFKVSLAFVRDLLKPRVWTKSVKEGS